MNSSALFKKRDSEALTRALLVGSFKISVEYDEFDAKNATVNFETGGVSGGSNKITISSTLFQRVRAENGTPDTSGGLEESDAVLWVKKSDLTDSHTPSTRDIVKAPYPAGVGETTLRYEVLSIDDVQGDTWILSLRRTS